MVLSIQILGVCFVLAALFFTYIQSRRDVISDKVTVTWSAVWVVLGVIVVQPSLFYPVMESLRIQRTSDMVFSIGIFLSLAMLFYLHIRISKLSSQFSRFVERRAREDEE